MSRHSQEDFFDPDPATEPIPVIAAETTASAPVPGRSRSRRVRALLSVGIVLGLGAVSTLAAWSATSATTSGQFTTGTVNIVANGQTNYTFTFPGTVFPGDTTAFVITVGNIGSIPFTYTAAVSSGTALAQAMTLAVRAGGSVTGTTCTGGTSVTTSTAIGSAPTTFTSTARGPLGAVTGTEALCVQLTLPSSASGTLAGASSDVLFTFTASQYP